MWPSNPPYHAWDDEPEMTADEAAEEWFMDWIQEWHDDFHSDEWAAELPPLELRAASEPKALAGNRLTVWEPAQP